MKILLTIIIALLMLNGNAQIGAIYGIGISSSRLPVAGVDITYQIKPVTFSVGMLIHIASNSTIPKIFVGSAGVDIQQFQVFGSISYQTIGGVSEAYFRHTPDEFINKFYTGGGVRYYFENVPWLIAVQQQGKFSILTIYRKI